MGQTLEKSLIIDFYLPILRIIPVFSRIHLGDRRGIDIFDPDCVSSTIAITVIKIWLWRY